MEINSTEDYRAARNKMYRFADALKIIEEIADMTDGKVWGPPITAINCTIWHLRGLINAYEEKHPEMFPAGKRSEIDEGKLDIGIGEDENGLVVIDFGRPVKWFALPPEEAASFAASIMTRAVHMELQKQMAPPKEKMN